MFLTGQVAPRTPYAIIADNDEIVTCCDYYTFCDIPQHQRAFQRHLERELESTPGTPIIGPVAELLYIALKGYKPHGSPDDCNLEMAIWARRAILSGCQLGHADALLAQKALVRWGPVVRPWWGTTKLDEEGHVLWDAPEYHMEIPLPELPPEWTAEAFYTTLDLGELRAQEEDDGVRRLLQG